MKKKDVGWDERESECEYLACKRLDEISSYNLCFFTSKESYPLSWVKALILFVGLFRFPFFICPITHKVPAPYNPPRTHCIGSTVPILTIEPPIKLLVMAE